MEDRSEPVFLSSLVLFRFRLWTVFALFFSVCSLHTSVVTFPLSLFPGLRFS